MEILILLTKQNMTIKGKCVYNGKPIRNWLIREDTVSPTVI